MSESRRSGEHLYENRHSELGTFSLLKTTGSVDEVEAPVDNALKYQVAIAGGWQGASDIS